MDKICTAGLYSPLKVEPSAQVSRPCPDFMSLYFRETAIQVEAERGKWCSKPSAQNRKIQIQRHVLLKI